ncbi:MAG: BglII/BstYI family type II restriction endonuclease [Humidesulfovibrio sp.]|uniref:BglII/BstYI family type II restriction endonuclease n=1 Tax=Humidesulfovibrio sp. TaxID=2910988 RepID=UPI0027E89BDA|nr:BglII/BstYI family type II restriction endonuclease [Humidesulfovibrio sp.]MDQ7836000.1 BglII/BstYI family type II restriction endonuclease [Humidesulfovibrio sp.]
MPIILRNFSYRFAEQVINSSLAIRQEIEAVLTDPSLPIAELSRPRFNEELETRFVARGWESQPLVFGEPGEPMAKMDFLKNRVGVEVEFGHASFIGIDLLKMQIGSYSGLDKIDIGVYVVTTLSFQKKMKQLHELNWEGSLNFEKVVKYLPHLKSAIQVPVLVYGIDLA